MENYAVELAALATLDQLHDDLLMQIDELDRRVEKALTDWQVCQDQRDFPT